MKKNVINVIIVVLIGVIVVCAYNIATYFMESAEQKSTYDYLATVVDKDALDETSGEDVKPTTNADGILLEYESLYEQNNDLIGWIEIKNTPINYPVMQSIDNPNYYLEHNFNKEYSDYGCPYVQEDCDLETSDNLVLHSHNMKDGSMFATLIDYKDESFWEEHKTVNFDTIYEKQEYEIVSVFITTANLLDDSIFEYYKFTGSGTEEDFNSYIDKVKELELYDTGVTAEYGDELITLSTCEYSVTEGRLVVVAKKI